MNYDLTGYEGAGDLYDLDNSLVVYYKAENEFRVNLSVGGLQLIFEHPLPLEEITRDNLKSAFKK